jgi:hypothetical protein
LTDGSQANPKIKATATVTAKRRKRKSQKESDPPAQKMRSQPRPSNMKRRKWRGKKAVIQNLRKKSKIGHCKTSARRSTWKSDKSRSDALDCYA